MSSVWFLTCSVAWTPRKYALPRLCPRRMADIYSKAKRSAIMAGIRSKNTEPERVVFLYLRMSGITFRRHYSRVPGRPDVAIPSKRRALFIDGDFWHGWRFPAWAAKLPNNWWREKIAANIRRDKRTFALLRRRGWRVMRVWGHQLSNRARRDIALRRVERFLS